MATSGNTRQATFCECGDHAWVALTKGFVTLVDSEDKILLSVDHHAHFSTATVYARASGQGYLHRAVMAVGSAEFIDHVDGNGLDNRKRNLRLATRQENNRNRRGRRRATSRYKGVWRVGANAWRAAISANGKTVNLGRFKTEELAAAAYDSASQDFHGDFAKANTEIQRSIRRP